MDFINRRVIAPVMSEVKKGVSPSKLALSLSVGIVIGLFPIPGTTSILCAIAAYFLALNQVSTQVVNLVVMPLELLLIPVHMKLGSIILNQPLPNIDIVEGLTTNFWETITNGGSAVFFAAIGWIGTAVIFCPLLYVAFVPLLTKLVPPRSTI